MFVAFLIVLAFVGGSSIVYFVMDGKRRQYQEGLNRLDKQKRRLIEDEQQLQRQYKEQLKKLGSQEQQLTLKAQKLAQEYSDRYYAVAMFGSTMKGLARYARTASRMMAVLASNQLIPRRKQ